MKEVPIELDYSEGTSSEHGSLLEIPANSYFVEGGSDGGNEACQTLGIGPERPRLWYRPSGRKVRGMFGGHIQAGWGLESTASEPLCKIYTHTEVGAGSGVVTGFIFVDEAEDTLGTSNQLTDPTGPSGMIAGSHPLGY